MQAEKVYNQDLYFKKAVKYVSEPMTHLESIASSAVCTYRILFCFYVFLSINVFDFGCCIFSI